MIHALLVGGLAFLLSLLIGRPVVAWLRSKKIGKVISLDQPSTHSVKAGTPTMGGIIIWGTVAVMTLLTNLLVWDASGIRIERQSMLLPLAVVVTTVIIGVWDDLGTLVGGTSRGLSWRIKFLLIATLGCVGWVVRW